jgi:alkanesulfonate monooxygenase SsuD/methylene tetrahydromethanopterin reductase-like flavin-dependent oxidoreductase (luciferase family)
LSEAVEIIARLLEGDEVTFKGDHYTIDGAVCRPRPVQSPRPPIWIGGKGDRLLETAARTADGWNFSWLGSPDTYRERAAAADRACERAGRDPASLRRSVGAYLLVGRDEADVKRRFERLAERTPGGVLDGSGGGGEVSLEGFRERGFVGSVQEVAERLNRLTELGVEEVVASLGALPFQVADEEDVELVGLELAPALR